MQKIKYDKCNKRNIKRKIGGLKSCKKRQQRREQQRTGQQEMLMLTFPGKSRTCQ